MPAKNKMPEAAYPGPIDEGGRPYSEGLGPMLDRLLAEAGGGGDMSAGMRAELLDALPRFIEEAYHEHQAQAVVEVRRQIEEVQKSLAHARRAAGALGEDAALKLDGAIAAAGLSPVDGLFDLIGRLNMIVWQVLQDLPAGRKEPDIIRHLAAVVLPIFEREHGPAPKSRTGPFVDLVGLVHRLLPQELQVSGNIGHRVKAAVEELKSSA